MYNKCTVLVAQKLIEERLRDPHSLYNTVFFLYFTKCWLDKPTIRKKIAKSSPSPYFA